jgi:hypothetical protein
VADLSATPGTGILTRTVPPQANAYAMIRRRAMAAGIQTKLGNHSFRAEGITACLKNGGTLEKASAMANHASTRTMQLYDRGRDEVTLDEIERIAPAVGFVLAPTSAVKLCVLGEHPESARTGLPAAGALATALRPKVAVSGVCVINRIIT